MNTDALHLQLTDDFLASVVCEALTIVRTLGNVKPSVGGKPADDNERVLQSNTPSVWNSRIPLNLSEELPVLW